MTDQPLWPSPPRRPGGKIRHAVLCPRTDPIVETVRRGERDQALVVERCSGCGHDDYAERLLARLDPDPDAA
jgi:hypothetical protein